MNTSITKHLFAIVATFSLALIANSADAQGYGESIINMEVLSDTASIPSTSNSYVGDMAASDAGVAIQDSGDVVHEGEGFVVGGGGQARRGFGQSDLFYNYYTQGNNRANAQMYISPLPVPPFVGHTYNTYQPFYPHHYLYHHKDRYHNYYDNGRGTNRTRAVYYSPPVRQAISNFYWNKIRLPR